MEKQVVGSLFGSANPRADIPKLLELYHDGQLDLDGLVTKTYTLDERQRRLRRHAGGEEHPRRHRLRLTGRRGGRDGLDCGDGRRPRAAWQKHLVGRRREQELVLAAIDAGRHVLIEGPPGTGKSTLLRAVAHELGVGFEFVEGNAELTPARLVGHFDPARVLADGYDPDVFVDGPLVTALRDGSLLYVEELNRVPEETLNVLITVMSERELHVPRLGRVVAAPGFRLVAAMNPFDAVGTARISGAVYDRVCRLGVGYQSADGGGDDRRAGRARRRRGLGRADRRARAAHPRPPRPAGRLVGARRARRRPRWRRRCRRCAGSRRRTAGVGLDAALVALSGRIRLREGAQRTPEDIIVELWDAVFGRPGDDGRPGGRGRRLDGKSLGPEGAPPRLKEGAEADAAVDSARRSTRAPPPARPPPRLRGGLARRRPARRGRLRRPDARRPRRGARPAGRHVAGDRPGAARAGPPPGRAADGRRRPARTGPPPRRRAHRDGAVPPRRRRPRPRRQHRRHRRRPRPPAAAIDPERLRVRRWVQPAHGAVPARRPQRVDGRPAAGDERRRRRRRRPPRRGRLQRRVVRPRRRRGQVAGRRTCRSSASSTRCSPCAAAARPTSPARCASPPASSTARSAGRKITILLSDCRATEPGDVAGRRPALDELVIIAPAGDDAAARALAAEVGAAITTVAGPTGIPDAFAAVLG